MEVQRISGKKSAKNGHAASTSGGRSVTARLRQTEDRLRALSAAAGQLTWIADAQGQMFEGMDSWRAFTGQTEDEARGMGWLTALHPDDREECRDLWRQARATRTLVIGSPRIYDTLGILHVFSLRAVPVATPNGRVTEWMVVCHEAPEHLQLDRERADLYERERLTRQAATTRAAELEATLEAVGDGLLVHDRRGGIVWLNSTASTQLGLAARPDFCELPPREQVLLLRLRDSEGRDLAPEDAPLARVLRGEALTGPHAVDISLRALDGRELHVSISAAAISQPDGSITGAVTVMRDVSARRQSERRLRESLDALLALAEGLVLGGEMPTTEPVIVPVLTPRDPLPTPTESMARRLVRLVCHLLGCQRAAILLFEGESSPTRSVALAGDTPRLERILFERMRDIPFEELAGPDDTARLHAGEVLAVSLLDPPFADIPNISASAVLAPLLVGERLIGVLALDRGAANGTNGAGTADERALARAVARMVAMVLERERLLTEREAARAEELALREANRLMDDFLSIASHELKTPIVGADLNMQAISIKLKRLRAATKERAHHQPIEQAIEMVERNQQQMRRLIRLVEDLLDTSRIKRGEIKIHPVPTTLMPIIENALADERAAYPQRAITLTALTDAALPLVADPDRIGQVVTNYLNNALSYSSEDRPISVLVTSERGTARVSVRDEGQGIAHDELPRIWGRFQRAAGVTRQTEAGIGFGLGLYISRAIIERHGGVVGVQSAPGQGSTFWFTLPLA